MAGGKAQSKKASKDHTQANGGSKTSSSQTRGFIGYIFSPACLICSAAAAFYFAIPSSWTAWLKPVPLVYRYRVVKQYPHDPKAFTQGLLWLNGSLYESVGLYGHSAVREVSLEDGKVVREAKNIASEFGEGLVYWKGELLQLLWRVGDGVRYSAKAGEGGHLKRTGRQFKTPFKDGWGLETDGESLLVTDNGPDIFFLDPETFRLKRQVRVTDDGRPIQMVNELEMIDGEVWANIFGTECIARISPATGKVTSWVLLEGILRRKEAEAAARKARRDPPDVLNGIAWDPEGKRLFVTGKLWPNLYEIELVPAESVSLEYARSRCIPAKNIFH